MKKVFMADGVIIAVGNGNLPGGEQISEARYTEILTAISSVPTAPEDHAYRLKTDLTWELHELPVAEDAELTAEEALDIIVGGAV